MTSELPRPTLAKIVATIGPASESPEMVRRLITAGVRVFRFNFSHGLPEDHENRLAVVRAAADELDMPVAVLGDLPGPKIRVGKVADPGIELATGDEVLIDPGAPASRAASGGGPTILSCTLAQLATDVEPGHKVLINDGAIRLLALERVAGATGAALSCRVIVGGLVTSGKGINLPMSNLNVPAMTERDWRWAEWAVNKGVDFLALSFVRSADEILRLKDYLASVCSVRKEVDASGAPASIPVIAKMEKPQAVEAMESICEAADGIMVARGDLGVEIDLAMVPVVQKRLIACADSWGKPCIVATQMLETMTTSAIPTRAEASDVANAIFDGADAVMLSGETAIGKHPTLVVETMRRIIMAAEERMAEGIQHASPPRRAVEIRYRTAALAHAAWHAARDFGAVAVATWSQSGGAARYLAQTGFGVPILAYSSSQTQTRRMALQKGVFAIRMNPPPPNGGPGELADWNAAVDRDLIKRGIAKEGDAIVLVAGRPLGVRNVTNCVALHRVGDRASGFMAF